GRQTKIGEALARIIRQPDTPIGEETGKVLPGYGAGGYHKRLNLGILIVELAIAKRVFAIVTMQRRIEAVSEGLTQLVEHHQTNPVFAVIIWMKPHLR